MIDKLTYQDLLNERVHYGHLTKRWHPAMAPYIFMKQNGIHIIDLNQTLVKIEETAELLKSIAKSGKKILFVATKKQFKEIITEIATRLNMPYITERWLGGMLTNFSTIRKSIKKLTSIEKMITDPSYQNLAKKERLRLIRSKNKLERVLIGLSDLTRLPAALFIIDINRETISVKEAHKLNISTFAIVDTNSDPTLVDYVIPANDDATGSVTVIMNYIGKCIEEGLSERKKDKEEVIKQQTADELVASSKATTSHQNPQGKKVPEQAVK